MFRILNYSMIHIILWKNYDNILVKIPWNFDQMIKIKKDFF
jgi:hypothetical protein